MNNVLILYPDTLGSYKEELIEERNALSDETFWHFQIQRLGIVQDVCVLGLHVHSLTLH